MATCPILLRLKLKKNINFKAQLFDFPDHRTNVNSAPFVKEFKLLQLFFNLSYKQ